MSLRHKIILLTLGVILFSTIGTGRLVGKALYDRLVVEAENRAQALIDGIALAISDHLAENRIDLLGLTIEKARALEKDVSDIVFLIVLDGDNRIVARDVLPGYEGILRNEFFSRAGVAKTQMKSRVSFHKHEIVLVSIPVQSNIGDNPAVRWGTVVGGMDISTIEQALAPVVRQAILAVLIFLTISLVLTMVLISRNVLSPVRQLSEAASRFAAGDLKWRAPQNDSDELGRLGSTMNMMADRIDENTRVLEEAVRTRTSELEQANIRLHELAAMDELTGLGNRRTFAAALKREFRRCRRDGARISLLMLDVDHFKNYNDTWGHPAGDVALNRIGAILRNRLRVTDIPCRYGGEEFVTILSATDRTAAAQIAETIRQMVEGETFSGEHSQPLGRFTVSIGISTFPDDADSPEKLVDAADIALYQAKSAGRNCVRVFEARMADKHHPESDASDLSDS